MADTTRKLTGYQLQEAIRRWELKKNTASKLFEDSLWAFEGDDKASPAELGETFLKAEEAVSELQTLQARYNLSVLVDVRGAKMTLCEAVKRVGGAGRHEKLWRTATTNTGHTRFGYGENPMSRKADEIHARRTIGVQDAMDRADDAARYAAALKAAIAQGNGQEREMEVPGDIFD
jgi:hypothetical protein